MTTQHHFKAIASNVALSAFLVGGLSYVALTDSAIAGPSPDGTDSVPTAHDLLAPVIKAEPLPPSPAPVSSSGDVAPAPSITVEPTPLPSVTTDGPTIEFSPSSLNAAPLQQTVSQPLAPATPILDLSELSSDIPVTDIDYSDSYLDTTDYSLGATPAPSMMPDIVFSERSTGCKTVLQQGQPVSSGFCGRVANASTTPGGSVLSSVGNALSQVSAALPRVNSVSIGPLSIGANGVAVTRRLSVQDYYNRSERPKSLPGNSNASLMFPLSIPAMISSPFGLRVHPIFGNVRMHTGSDLAAPMGTPVVAAYSGRVAVSDFMGGYGLAVVIGHSEKSAETLYGHLSEVFVKAGEWVEQGEIIGRVGSTGNSTGPHLHFELRQRTANGWVAVNSGSLLQQGLTSLHQGFQLGEGFSIADASLLDPVSGEVKQLSIPTVLQRGKYATKEDIDLASASLTDTETPVALESTVPDATNHTPANPKEQPQPGSWVSPKELVKNEE